MVRDEIIPLDHEFLAEVGKEGDRLAYTARQTEILEGLKAKARERGLWNFWLTGSDRGYGLSTVEYAYLAEEMGKAHLGAETFNCSAPDTGNMEVLERYGAPEHKKKWLEPLLEGKIRSAYLMTEPDVASSDATNICDALRGDGDDYVLNGEKWWSSGAGDPRCAIYIVMVRTDPRRAEAPAAFDDPGAGRHEGRHQAARHAGLWRRRRAARPHAPAVRQCARAEGQPDPRRGQGLRDRAGPARARPHPSLHARHRPGRDGAGDDVPALAVGARPSAASWPSSAPISTSSPNAAWRSSRRGCSASRRPG